VNQRIVLSAAPKALGEDPAAVQQSMLRLSANSIFNKLLWIELAHELKIAAGASVLSRIEYP
jgi:hypothetical protein